MLSTNIVLILIAYTSHFVRHGVVFPLVPLLADAMGAGPSAIGFAVGAFSLIAVFLSIPLGGLIDRFGVRRLLLGGVLGNITNALILLQTTTMLELVVAQMIGGLAFLLHVVASQAFISRLARAADREKGFGYLSFCAAAGMTVGPILGGFLVEQFDYRIAFAAALILSSIGLSVLGMEAARESESMKASYSLVRDARQAGVLALDRQILAILVFTFVIIFAVSLRTSFLPVLLRGKGFTEASVGFLLSVFAAVSTCIRLFFGKVLEAWGRKIMVGFAMLAVVAGVGFIPAMSSLAGFALLLAVFGMGFGLSQPLSMTMMADLADPSFSGLTMGVRFTAIMLANLLSPVLLGFVAEAFGLGSAFYGAGFVVMLTGLYILVLRPELLPGRREDI